MKQVDPAIANLHHDLKKQENQRIPNGGLRMGNSSSSGRNGCPPSLGGNRGSLPSSLPHLQTYR